MTHEEVCADCGHTRELHRGWPGCSVDQRQICQAEIPAPAPIPSVVSFGCDCPRFKQPAETD